MSDERRTLAISDPFMIAAVANYVGRPCRFCGEPLTPERVFSVGSFVGASRTPDDLDEQGRIHVAHTECFARHAGGES